MIRQALLLKARPSFVLAQACRMAHSVVAGSATAPELLKVVAAAHFGGQKVSVSVDGTLGSSVQLRTTDGARITDASAAALFLGSGAAAPSLKVEEWVAWDSRVLAPAIAKAVAAGPAPAAEALAASAAHSSLVDAVKHVDRALAAGAGAGAGAAAAGVIGGKLSLADVVIAADLAPAVDGAAKFPLAAVSAAVSAHVAAVVAQAFFKAAAADVAGAKPVPAAAAVGEKRKADAPASAAAAGEAAAGKGAGKAAKKEGGAAAAGGAGAAAAAAPAAAGAEGGKKAVAGKGVKGGAAAATGAAGEAVASKADTAKGLDVSSMRSGVPIDMSDAAAPALLRPMEDQLKAAFTAALHAAIPAAAAAGLEADVTVQNSPRFFHQYQCNSAVQVVGKLKGKDGAPTNPRAAADAIVAALAVQSPKSPLIGKVEVSGPGFINIYLAVDYLSARLVDLLTRGVRPLPPARKFKVVVDYSSPNIAKEMHIGHLRSTIIGDTLARILEFVGHEVLRVNHVGDWGTQFGMLLAHLKDEAAAGRSIEGSIGDITAFYKAAKVRFDSDPVFKDRAHKEVVALQNGDATNRAMWQKMIEVSQATYDEVYRRLDIDKRLALCGESFYNDKIPAVIEEMRAKGLLETSEGALICKVPGEEVPLMVRKSDGGVGYDSTDLAAIKYRLHSLHADWLVYVIDSGQSLHCNNVFAGARLAGWYTPLPPGSDYDPPAADAASDAAAGGAGAGGAGAGGAVPAMVQHVGFGVIQGDDRKKYKTRSGDVVRLVDVLDEAKDRAKAALLERAAAGSTAVDEAAVERTAAILGYGGAKYFDLRQHRSTDYVFSYDRMLSPDGDTAVYLNYAHARLASILRKAGEGGVDVAAILAGTAAEGVAFSHPTEMALATELLRFPDVLRRTTAALTPHLLCEFVYSVANRTAEFHRDCNVLGATTAPEVRASRIRMVAAVKEVIASTMRLLGITPLDRI